jgi:putative endonuclease
MKQQLKQGEKNKVGAYGEQIAVNYLKKLGFSILNTNYLKKWGEIDIVACETAEKARIIHFVEVKTVSYETKERLQQAVSYGTYRPEENVHKDKLKRINRTIESWLTENNSEDAWQVDVCAVRIVPREKYATIKYLPNIIID